jgi:hypothetical protein
MSAPGWLELEFGGQRLGGNGFDLSNGYHPDTKRMVTRMGNAGLDHGQYQWTWAGASYAVNSRLVLDADFASCLNKDKPQFTAFAGFTVLIGKVN